MSQTSPAPPDLNSILTQVKTLETERAKLEAERESLLKVVEDQHAKNDKLSESKRQEMGNALNTVIMKMIQVHSF